MTRTRLTAAALVVGLVVSLVGLRFIRVGEAALSTLLLRLMGTGADQVGSAVLVDTDSGRAGFTIASGCSTALLVAPFLVVGALALLTGRVQPRRAVASLAVSVAGVVIVNQLRFGVVGGAIHLWGFERGYGQSHVLIGTLVSTLGLVGGLTIFIWLLARTRPVAGTGPSTGTGRSRGTGPGAGSEVAPCS